MNSTTGLYVHFPYCVHKCGYCDFNSWAETARAPQERWLEALNRQAVFWAERLSRHNVEIDTVFFGGGTPSLMENDLLVKTGDMLRAHFSFAKNLEWTFECNPETLDAKKIQALAAAGATRLSVGIQSFDDVQLERLERRARRQHNMQALNAVRDHWKGPWSLDLMFGLPGQTLKAWSTELETVRAFDPSHVSAYQLTLTTARSRNWNQGSEDELLEMFNFTEEFLAEQGCPKYEVSNFAKPGYECRHNLRYWNMDSFVGLGPGASGLLPSTLVPEKKSGWGFHQKQPDKWETWSSQAGNPLFETANVTPRTSVEHLEELLMMGLRLNTGIKKSVLEPWKGALENLSKNKYLYDFIESNDSHLQLNARGARILDHLLPLFYKHFEVAPHPLDS